MKVLEKIEDDIKYTMVSLYQIVTRAKMGYTDKIEEFFPKMLYYIYLRKINLYSLLVKHIVCNSNCL